MTDYVLVLSALAIGTAFGALFLRTLLSEPAVAVDQGLGLAQRAERALEQLKELSVERSHYSDAVFAEEKQRLERDAAVALKARDDYKKSAKASSRRLGFTDHHPMWAGALYGGVSVGFAALLAIGLMDASQQRQAVQPISAVTQTNDPRYEALMVLSAIALEYGETDELLQAWQLYMRQQPPRKAPPQLKRALDWLEKRVENQ